LSENQQAIIALLIEDGGITRALLSQKLGISEKSVSSNIKTLKELGIIDRIGSDRIGKWRVTDG
jgi:predicted HTH transcriptional regulator